MNRTKASKYRRNINPCNELKLGYDTKKRSEGLLTICHHGGSNNEDNNYWHPTLVKSIKIESSLWNGVAESGNEAVDGRGSDSSEIREWTRNVTSAREDRRLLRTAQTDRTAFSRQLAAQWSTAAGVSLCASSIRRRLLQRRLRARIPLCRIPLTQNHRRLRLHWANVHRSWRADWQQVVFSDKSRFNLWHHDGGTRVRLYAGERRIPECIIERHSGRTPGVMV
ncbi:transposable element Tc1 transposase [Trichonephila clavipes]|nr:transposable element Tc1 transposase [Trichonephila clavipes]